MSGSSRGDDGRRATRRGPGLRRSPSLDVESLANEEEEAAAAASVVRLEKNLNQKNLERAARPNVHWQLEADSEPELRRLNCTTV
jgi:hypothetical protein